MAGFVSRLRWVGLQPLSPGRRSSGQLALGIAVSEYRGRDIRDCEGNVCCLRDVRPVGSNVAWFAHTMRPPTFFSETLKTHGIIENVDWVMTSSDSGVRSGRWPLRDG